MSAAPEVSVVIPTCGRTAALRDTLAALLAQEWPAEGMEVIVVADGEHPETIALVEGMASTAPCDLRALQQPRAGQGSARNRGIREARGRVVLMLDDDIVAAPELAAAHMKHHAGLDDVVVTGPLPVEPMRDEPAHRCALRSWWDGELAEKASAAHRPTFRDFATGNVSVARERLLASGGFDPDFGGYGREDYELGYRLLRGGARFVYEPRAVGVHRFEKAPLQWLRQMEPMGRADVLFARKHPEIAGEIMTLSRFSLLPWIPAAVALGERLVLLHNQRGGEIWRWAAGLTQASYYWRGIRGAAADGGEFRRLVEAHHRERRRTSHIGVVDRLLIARVRHAA